MVLGHQILWIQIPFHAVGRGRFAETPQPVQGELGIRIDNRGNGVIQIFLGNVSLGFGSRIRKWDRSLWGEQAGISIEGTAFTEQLRAQLEAAANEADKGFPDNEYLQIENGEPLLKRLRRNPDPEGLQTLERLLKERMTPVDIVDALSDTDYWLNWTRHFGPISGHDAKLENPRERYLITAFCYGCNLGPTQTARSIKGLDRRQLAFVNQLAAVVAELTTAANSKVS
jgi:Tn3 transposase DDE domain